MKKFRIGLVGAGTHGRGAVAPALSSALRCELVAVADPSAESLAQLAMPAIRRYRSLHQMLENEELDGIYIATLASSHCELALQAFARGLHVVCEKPLAASADEAERMVMAAESAGRELLVMFENRSKPHYQKIREWIATGAIGQVEAIHLQSFGKHPSQQPRRTNLLNESGCLDCGIHMLDLVRFWMGGGEWDEIHALGAWFGEKTRLAPHLGILARLDRKIMVTFEDSFSYGRLVSKTPWNFNRSTLAIIGTHGVIVDGYAADQPCFQLVSDDRMETGLIIPSSHRHEIGVVVDDFVATLWGEDESRYLATGRDGLAAQQIVDEVHRQSVAKRTLHSSEHIHALTL